MYQVVCFCSLRVTAILPFHKSQNFPNNRIFISTFTLSVGNVKACLSNFQNTPNTWLVQRSFSWDRGKNPTKWRWSKRFGGHLCQLLIRWPYRGEDKRCAYRLWQSGKTAVWLSEIVLHQCTWALLLFGLKWRRGEIFWFENKNQNISDAVIVLFEVALVSWTGRYLSVSDGLKKNFYRMSNSCLLESLSLFSSSSASLSSLPHARCLKRPVNHDEYELIMNLFVLVCTVNCHVNQL